MVNWFNHLYPYSNLHELNLDWILATVKNLAETMNEFVSLNTIKYADPIQWNITTQYEKNTVVIDPVTGTAYISTNPVPSGVGLNNEDYWSVIFTLDIISANKNITLRDDANNTLATFESEIDDWLLSNGTLYKVTRNIDIGNAYVVGYNLERFTVEMYLKAYITNVLNTINTLIGDLDDLATTDKTNIVSAINDVLSTLNTLIGDLDDLATTDKTNIVSAINDVLSTLNTLIGDLDDLTTTDKTNIVSAINELVTTIGNINTTIGNINTSIGSINSSIGNLNNLTTTDKSSVVNAINEIDGNIGDLSNLNTTDKSSIVNAINETLAEALKGTFINITDYGAIGDGSTDNSTIINDIFTNLNGGEIIVIPSGDFRVLSDINITKPCTILGGGSFMKGLWSGSHEGSILRFSGGHGIRIKSAGVNIEGIGIIGNASNVAIEYQPDSEIGIGSICGSLRNINIWQVNFGVKFINCFKTVMENVFVHTATVCFELGESPTGFTSLTMINCWGASSTHGFRMYVGIYSSLINCACDNCQYGYELYGCGGVKLLNCGVEGATVVPVIMDSCTDVVVDGLVAVDCGGSTYNSSLVRIQSGNSRCTVTNSQTINPKTGMYGIVCISSSTDNFIYNNKINNINYAGTVVNDNHIVLQADS